MKSRKLNYYILQICREGYVKEELCGYLINHIKINDFLYKGNVV